jgi:hypothetical protein
MSDKIEAVNRYIEDHIKAFRNFYQQHIGGLKVHGEQLSIDISSNFENKLAKITTKFNEEQCLLSF